MNGSIVHRLVPASDSPTAFIESQGNSDTSLLPVVNSVASSPLDLPTVIFKEGLDRRKTNRQALMSWIKSALIENTDFGSIKTKRGLSKPSLFKPGAEKICGMLGVTARFPTLYEYEQAVLACSDFQHIILRCELLDSSNRIVADGVGARSLKQDFGDLNKSLKMATKSAHIDATLRMAGLSEVFTQDLEDQSSAETSTTENSTATSTAIINPDQLRTLQGLLHKQRVDPAKFQDWLERLCSAKGFPSVNQLNLIPAMLFDGIIKKVPDFAFSAADSAA